MKGIEDFLSHKLAWELQFAKLKMGRHGVDTSSTRPKGAVSDEKLQDFSEKAYKEFYNGALETLLQDLSTEKGDQEAIQVLQSILPETKWCWRCYVKPLGYAGDYKMMQYLYEFVGNFHVEDYTTLSGWALDRWVSQYGEDVKDRASYLSNYLFSKCSGNLSAMRITSIACGPLEEYRVLQSHLKNYQGPTITFTGLDADTSALAHIKEMQRGEDKASMSTCVKLHQVNVVLAAKGRSPTPMLQPQNVIYSVGLMDYLDDRHFIQVANWAFDLLCPGGELILGNFLADDHCKAIAAVKTLGKKVLDWHLIYRSQQQLEQLIQATTFGETGSKVSIEVGRAGLQAYLHVQRPLSSTVTHYRFPNSRL